MRKFLLAVNFSSFETRRNYTPIFSPDPPHDHLLQSIRQEERDVLWGPNSSNPLPTLSEAICRWLRFGNDPCLNTINESTISLWKNSEDFLGANVINVENKEHFKESIAVWIEFYQQQYANLIRHSRRGAANDIGTLKGREHIRDEADQPRTTWDRDTHFREMAFLASKCLKKKVANQEQFERELKRCGPKEYIEFIRNFSTQTQTLIPLPVAACWVYDNATEQEEWVHRWKPLQLRREEFVAMKLIPAVNRKEGNRWEVVAHALASAEKSVMKIRRNREQRQIESGLLKRWEDMTKDEKMTKCRKEQELFFKAIVDREFDPEDANDSSEEWIKEQEEIVQTMSKNVPGEAFSPLDFWQNYTVSILVEYEHLYSVPAFRDIRAACFVRMRNESGQCEIDEGLADAIEKSHFDQRSGIVVPYLNDIWMKANWSMFGASTMTHHTPASKRLLIHQYHTLPMARALATLHFKLQPLSSALNYSTPYLYRESYVQCCAEYGLGFTQGVHSFYLGQTNMLGKAEEAISTVVQAACCNLGKKRRAAAARIQAANKKFDPSINLITVKPLDGTAGSETVWAFGSKRKVKVDWECRAVEEVVRNPGVGKEKVLKEIELRHKGAFEISLWQRKERQSSHESERREISQKLCEIEELKAIRDHSARFFDELTKKDGHQNSKEEELLPDSEWEYVTVLDDFAGFNVSNEVEVLIPFFDKNGKNLEDGEYRLRARAFDHQVNPMHFPTRFSEAFSAPFKGCDALPMLLQAHFGSADVARIVGGKLVPLCTFFRAAGIEVPLKLEFEAGQELSAKGEVVMEYFISLLKGGKFTFTAPNRGLTDDQLEAEKRIRAHWNLYHPGATEEEWAGVRRGVLDHAFEQEQEWWREDPQLSQTIHPSSVTSTMRYGSDLCTVLSAKGHSHSPELLQTSVCTCEVNGDGTVSSLGFDEEEIKKKRLSFDDVLLQAQAAINDGHCRLNTLAAARLDGIHKESQHCILNAASITDYGGKFGKTYLYAFEKAKQELDVEPMDWRAKEREKPIDRFASQDHPEQRRRLFTSSVVNSLTPSDDPVPDNTSTWNNTF